VKASRAPAERAGRETSLIFSRRRPGRAKAAASYGSRSSDADDIGQRDDLVAIVDIFDNYEFRQVLVASVRTPFTSSNGRMGADVVTARLRDRTVLQTSAPDNRAAKFWPTGEGAATKYSAEPEHNPKDVLATWTGGPSSAREERLEAAAGRKADRRDDGAAFESRTFEEIDKLSRTGCATSEGTRSFRRRRRGGARTRERPCHLRLCAGFTVFGIVSRPTPRRRQDHGSRDEDGRRCGPERSAGRASRRRPSRSRLRRHLPSQHAGLGRGAQISAIMGRARARRLLAPSRFNHGENTATCSYRDVIRT